MKDSTTLFVWLMLATWVGFTLGMLLSYLGAVRPLQKSIDGRIRAIAADRDYWRERALEKAHGVT